MNRCRRCGRFLQHYAFDDEGRSIYLCWGMLTSYLGGLVYCGAAYARSRTTLQSIDYAWVDGKRVRFLRGSENSPVASPIVKRKTQSPEASKVPEPVGSAAG